MIDREHPEPFAAARQAPQVDVSDVPDLVLAAVRRESGLLIDAEVRAVAAAVCDALASETPEHHGPLAQSNYRAWLERRAAALREGRRWVRPVTTSFM